MIRNHSNYSTLRFWIKKDTKKSYTIQYERTEKRFCESSSPSFEGIHKSTEYTCSTFNFNIPSCVSSRLYSMNDVFFYLFFASSSICSQYIQHCHRSKEKNVSCIKWVPNLMVFPRNMSLSTLTNRSQPQARLTQIKIKQARMLFV